MNRILGIFFVLLFCLLAAQSLKAEGTELPPDHPGYGLPYSEKDFNYWRGLTDEEWAIDSDNARHRIDLAKGLYRDQEIAAGVKPENLGKLYDGTRKRGRKFILIAMLTVVLVVGAVLAVAYKKRKPLYPWYDSRWLTSFEESKKIIKRKQPKKLKLFEETLKPFRTRLDFKEQKIENVLDEKTLQEIKKLIHERKISDWEAHELDNFGRLILHDDPYFIALQKTLTELVSEVVKEPVEPCYNFLSLYHNMGVCPVHLDAPSAKWTLDICIDQSRDWPIHFSETFPWPENFKYKKGSWAEDVKNDPQNHFTSYLLKPGEGIVFSGSSQWHYREPIEQQIEGDYCDLIFFHFVPKGFLELSQPKNWAKHFDIPELS